jgi:hypothetical protein
MSPISAGRGGINEASACRILIVAALPLEVRPFLRRVRAKARRDLGLPAWEWEAGAAVAALSGMGQAAARRAGEILMGRSRPELLVSVGFGGALTPGLAAGDLVLGETFWHYNPDTRELQAGPQPVFPRPLPLLCGALQQAGLTAVTGSLVTTGRAPGRSAPAGSGPGDRRPGGDGRGSRAGLFEPQGHYRRGWGRNSGIPPGCRRWGGDGGDWRGPPVAGGRLAAAHGPPAPLAPEPRRRPEAGRGLDGPVVFIAGGRG